MVNVTSYHQAWNDILITTTLFQTLCGTLNLCRQAHGEAKKTQVERVDGGGSRRAVDAGEVVFDLMCVSLGLLANLVEQSSNGKELLHTTCTCFAVVGILLACSTAEDRYWLCLKQNKIFMDLAYQ